MCITMDAVIMSDWTTDDVKERAEEHYRQEISEKFQSEFGVL